MNPPIPNQPDSVYAAIPAGISDGGVIVGTYFDDSGFWHGFIKQGEAFTTVDVPGALATSLAGLNNRAHMDIVGQYIDAQSAAHGFVLRDGKFTTIDVPFGVDTSLNAINDHRQIVGTYASAGVQFGFQAVLPESEASDKASAFVSVQSPQSASYPGMGTQLLGVSNHGDVIGAHTSPLGDRGETTTDAFQIVNGTFQFLSGGFDDDGAFHSIPSAINDSGIIVGQTTILSGAWAMIWSPWNLFDSDFSVSSTSTSTIALPAGHNSAAALVAYP